MATGPSPALERVDHDHLRALGDQLLRLQRRRSATLTGTHLETSAFRLLWVLADDEPRTLRELAGELDLEQSTVNRQVNAALTAGLLERLPATPANRLRPAPAGCAAYRHDVELRAGLIAEALDHLGPERTARLVADLTDFNDAWDAAREA